MSKYFQLRDVPEPPPSPTPRKPWATPAAPMEVEPPPASPEPLRRGRGRPKVDQAPYTHAFAGPTDARGGAQVYVVVREKPLQGFEATVVEQLPPKTKTSSEERYRLKTKKGKLCVRRGGSVYASRGEAYRTITARTDLLGTK